MQRNEEVGCRGLFYFFMRFKHSLEFGIILQEFKRYELEIEGLMKAHQHKHFEEFQSFKLEIEEERKVNQQREMKIIEVVSMLNIELRFSFLIGYSPQEIHELKEELKKMKMQLDKDVVKVT